MFPKATKAATIVFLLCLSCSEREAPTQSSMVDVSGFRAFLSELSTQVIDKEVVIDEDVSAVEIANNSQRLDPLTNIWETISSGFIIDSTATKLKTEVLPILVKLSQYHNLYFEEPSRVSFGIASQTEFQKADGTWYLSTPSNFFTIIDNVTMIRVMNGSTTIAIDKPTVYYVIDRDYSKIAICTDNASSIEIKRSELITDWEPVINYGCVVSPSDRIRNTGLQDAGVQLQTGGAMITQSGSIVTAEHFMKGVYSYRENSESEFLICGGQIGSEYISSKYENGSFNFKGNLLFTISPLDNTIITSDLYLQDEIIGHKIRNTPLGQLPYANYYIALMDSLKRDFLSSSNFTGREKFQVCFALDNNFRTHAIDSLIALYEPTDNPDRDTTPEEIGNSLIELVWEIARIGHFRHSYMVEPWFVSIDQETVDLTIRAYEGRYLIPTEDIWELCVPRNSDREEMNLRDTILGYYNVLKYGNHDSAFSRGSLFARYYDLMVTRDYISTITAFDQCHDPECYFVSTWDERARQTQVNIVENVVNRVFSNSMWAESADALGEAAGEIAGEIYDLENPRVCNGEHPSNNNALQWGNELWPRDAPPLYSMPNPPWWP